LLTHLNSSLVTLYNLLGGLILNPIENGKEELANKLSNLRKRNQQLEDDDILYLAEEALRESNKQLEADLEDAKLLQGISMELIHEDNIQTLYESIMDAATKIMQSEYASMQMLHTDKDRGDKLQLLAFRGFNPKAAKFWEWVYAEDAGSTCSEALRTGQRAVAPNVEQCDFIVGTEDLHVFLQTGIHAAQTTPLYSRNGKMIGMISTHWSRPHEPSERDLRLLDVLARQAADIIEQILYKNKLLESEEKYRALFEYMNEGFFLAEIIFDGSGKPVDYLYLATNPALETIIELNRVVIIGKRAQEINIFPITWINTFSRVATTGEPITLEGFFENLNRHLLVKIFSPKHGQFACLMQDISKMIEHQQKIKKQQEALLKAEQERRETIEAAMKVKDEFIYLITHEFKTPIAVISSVLQTIEAIFKAGIDERLARYLNMIKMNTNRQLRLVNNLLDITKLNSGYIKVNKRCVDIVYISRSIVNSVEVYAKQKQINLIFVTDFIEKKIYMDEEKFERIMLNLLSNALKFTSSRKNISVLLSVKKHKKKDFISVSVKDEGIGIPADKQKIVFDRFGQADTSLSRQAEGTGLGLHLVKLLVNVLEGEISLISDSKIGSTFTILLPAVEISPVDEDICPQINPQLISGHERIIQAVCIEFSDIYFD
jgi:signal transduction histidine kinase